jgi:hypothetical protein
MTREKRRDAPAFHSRGRRFAVRDIGSTVAKNSTGWKDSDGDNVLADILWLERLFQSRMSYGRIYPNDIREGLERIRNVKDCFQDAVAKSKSRC